jgi:hypothetical protein
MSLRARTAPVVIPFAKLMNSDSAGRRVANPLTRSFMAAGTALLLACGSTSERADRPAPAELTRDSAATSVAIDTAPAAPDRADIRFVVDLAQRTLFVLGAVGDTVGRYRLAVGSAEWPTRTGQWAIQQVVLNPLWTPPDESWGEEREPRLVMERTGITDVEGRLTRARSARTEKQVIDLPKVVPIRVY